LAVSLCTKCNEILCETCSDEHIRAMESRSCKLTNLTEKGREAVGDRKSRSSVPCPRHVGKCVEVYCVTCVEAMCVMCFIERHQMHRCIDVDDVLDDFRRELKIVAAKIAKCVGKYRGVSSGFAEIDAEHEKRAVRVENEINKRAEQLKELIDLHREDLLLKVRTAIADRKTLGARIGREMDQRVAVAEDFLSSVEHLTDSGTVVEVAQKMSGVRRRVGEIMTVANQTEDDYHTDLESDYFTFAAALLTTSTDNNFVGRVDIDSCCFGTVVLGM